MSRSSRKMAGVFGPRSGVRLSGGLGGPHYGRLTMLTPAPSFSPRGDSGGEARRGVVGYGGGGAARGGRGGDERARSLNHQAFTTTTTLRATQRYAIHPRRTARSRLHCNRFYCSKSARFPRRAAASGAMAGWTATSVTLSIEVSYFGSLRIALELYPKRLCC